SRAKPAAAGTLHRCPRARASRPRRTLPALPEARDPARAPGRRARQESLAAPRERAVERLAGVALLAGRLRPYRRAAVLASRERIGRRAAESGRSSRV